MGQLHDLTALEQAAAVRSRTISPVELVEHCLERVDRLNDDLGAFLTVTAESARREARQAEARVMAGEAIPPLHGVPIAIKDLNNTKGVRTTFGSVAGLELVPDFDDDVVVSLRAAGTISLGKTNVPEFGLPNYTESAIGPPARTPWDLSRSAGGSSGGAAAAVAGGLIPFAHGNDGGGSVRIPAAVCGLVGIKPSRGRISNGPASLDPGNLVHQGPLARTVRDAAALLDAMADGTGGAVALPPGRTFLEFAEREPGTLRIGRYCATDTADGTLDPSVRAAYEATTELLVSLGHQVEELVPPPIAASLDDFMTMWSAAPAAVQLPPEAEAVLRPFTQWLRARGAEIPATAYLRAADSVRALGRRLMLAGEAFDAVLVPTVALPPRPVGAARDDDPEADFAGQADFAPWTALYNVTGQPVLNVPVSWSETGLPIGMSLVGKLWDEASILSLAAQLETVRPWADRKPACW
ncbi:amidase [Amycolatopsis halotolerans]|uniref:Amidase n=1 Tax=Amycolatopsis halotolerans TaxID=330083 RepID=A0ABV7QDS9_9PSEU